MSVSEKTRVVVAMSGGVDSSVAAALLVKQGYEVLGISMRLYSYEKQATHGCCTPEDLYDARRVADQLKIPHYVADFEETFEGNVIRPFVDAYRIGETPNPCVRCNQDVKFSILMKRALGLGAKYLATGHYARKESINGKYRLLRARDTRRDQSYFLYGIGQEELASLLFPLGELTKDEVRQAAREIGIPVAEKPDSQEICFVPDDYKDFVESRVPVGERVPGVVVDRSGTVLGQHDGIHQFTVGQRKGLGLQGLLPRYVLAVDRGGTVTVGEDDDLRQRCFEIRETRWVSDRPAVGESLRAQIRSRFEPADAIITDCSNGRVQVEFKEPQRAITPGQAAVLYRGDEVLGGGWIDRVLS